MGRYEGSAKKIAQYIASVLHEKAALDASIITTANNMVVNLGDLAEDLNAALKQEAPTFKAEVRANQWKKVGEEMHGSLTVTGDKNGEVKIVAPIGNLEPVTVNGKAVERGDSALTVINKELLAILMS